jgi:hypothetical protein
LAFVDERVVRKMREEERRVDKEMAVVENFMFEILGMNNV